MALGRLSLLIIFAAFLLFSQVLARDLEEKPAADEKDAVFSQTQMNEFNDEKYGGCYRYRCAYGCCGYRCCPPPYHGPPCRYRCGYRCCSAEEYAEFVQGGN